MRAYQVADHHQAERISHLHSRLPLRLLLPPATMRLLQHPAIRPRLLHLRLQRRLV